MRIYIMCIGEKMEVKVVKKLGNLPRVFSLPDLNKVSLSDKIENCAKYKSRSGATISGCLKVIAFNNKIDISSVKEIRGIFFTPHDPIISLKFRQKAIGNEDDVKAVLSSIDLSKVSLKRQELLVKYDNYNIKIFDIYVKGKTYEFSVIEKQGRLTVYQVPEPKNVYKIMHSNNIEVKEFDKEQFEEVSEFNIYNHKISFANSQLLYKNLVVFGGDAELVYIHKGTAVKIESPDHQPKEFVIQGNNWLLFSHPRPHSGKD